MSRDLEEARDSREASPCYERRRRPDAEPISDCASIDRYKLVQLWCPWPQPALQSDACTNFVPPSRERWSFRISWHFVFCNLQNHNTRGKNDPVSGHHIFNNLQAHRTTITFRNVPTARRSRSTPTPRITGTSSAASRRADLADGHLLRCLKRLARKDKPNRLTSRRSGGSNPPFSASIFRINYLRHWLPYWLHNRKLINGMSRS